MKEVTDPNIIKMLEGDSQEVTDPNILAALEGGAPVEQDAGFDWNKAMQNFPDSLGRALEAIAMPVYRPGQFIEGLKNVGMAGVENFASNMNPALPEEYQVTETPALDDLIAPYVERYGSLEGLKKAAEEDPAGVGLDVISALTGGAGAARAAGTTTKAAIGDKPAKMIEEVVKFPPSKHSASERKAMAETILDEKISLSPEGLTKVGNLIEDLNSEVDRIIAANDKGADYPRAWVLRNLEKMKNKTLGQIEGRKDRQTINKIISEQLKEIEEVGRPNMSLKELQDFKKNTYKKVNWNQAKNKQVTKNETYREIGKTARQDIESLAPEVSAVNKREGALIELLDALEQPVNRIDNRDMFGIDAAIKPGAGHLIGGAVGASEIGTIAGAIAHLGGRPKMKAAIAQFMHNLKKKEPKISDRALAEAAIASFIPQVSEAGDSENPN